MLLEFDDAKSVRNLRDRGIGFDRFACGERTGARGDCMKKNYSDQPDDENPEWTEKDFRAARPVLDAAPEIVEAILRYRGQRGRQKTPTKELISLRVDRDVVKALRASGAGWQSRANDVLRNHVKRRGLKASPAGGSRRG